MIDCEAWRGRSIERISSDEYLTIDEVCEHRKFLSGCDFMCHLSGLDMAA